MADLVKHPPEFGRSRSHRGRIGPSIAENPQNWDLLEPRRLGMEGVADSLKNKTSPSPRISMPNLVVLG